MIRKGSRYQSIKSFADLPENWKQVLFGIVSIDPLELEMEMLAELLKYNDVPHNEWDPMLETFGNMGYGPRYYDDPRDYEKGISEYSRTYELKNEAIRCAILAMKESDVCTAEFAVAYAALRKHKRGRFVDDDLPLREYEYALKKFTSDDPDTVRPPEGLPEVEYELIYQIMREPRLAAMTKGQKEAYFSSLPAATINDLILDFLYPGNRIDELKGMVKTLEHCAEGVNIYLVRDKLTLLEFFQKGDPHGAFSRMDPRSVEYHIMQALILAQNGNAPDAAKSMRKALKINGSPRYFSMALYNWCLGLVFYLDRTTPATLKTMKAVIKDRQHDDINNTQNAYMGFFCALGAKVDPFSVHSNFLYYLRNYPNQFSSLDSLLFCLIIHGYHLRKPDASAVSKLAQGQLKEALNTYPVLAQIWTQITDPASPKNAEFVERLKMQPLIAVEKELQPWEQALQDLIEIATAGNKAVKKPAAARKESGARVCYMLDMRYFDVEPVQQKTKADHGWTSGSAIPLKKFAVGDCEGMTDQDRAIAATMRVEGSGSRPRRYLGGGDTLMAMVGHPLVFDSAHPDTRIEVIKGEMELSVKKNAQGHFDITTNVDVGVNKYFKYHNYMPSELIDGSADGKVTLYDFSETQKQLLSRLNKFRTLPPQAEKRLATLMEQLAPTMPVFSDLIKTSGKERQSKQGDSKISLQISQADAGMFSARAVVRPYAGSKITCEPGHGQEYLMAASDGATVQVRRDLKSETANFKALEPLMEAFDDSRNDTYDWTLDTENCLKLLEMVRENGKLCTVEWPEGEKLKVKKAPLTFSSVNLGIRRLGTWFDVTGTVSVDAKTRLKAAELLELVRGGVGNFIALGNDEYVALTEALKKQLSLLDRYSAGRGKKIELSIFNSGVLDELEKNGAVIDADAQYRDLMARIKKADQTVPAIPTNLKAELRDYQQDGFEWLMRLASWDAGALLADDMGLGKTVQTIALLLARAKTGPQLVVVPASLLFNWKEELARFAPSLKAEIYNLSANRRKLVEDLGPNKVLIATYGVVSSDIEALSEIKWTTAVLDEAHNIKNKETKAFKAIVRLQADFRILLTGTPLQNHLTEIWALYEFAVPGLLGSFKSFSERFVLPIEKDHDKDQQRLLKRIVSPFILRRTKNDVLAELPEKTEITVRVTLSDEERAIYEQLRQETSTGFATGEINPVQALAALLRLRQAACSTELVDPKLQIPSSKTEAFLSLCDDLMEGHHRALVFSQFTSHLALIRRELDRKGVDYLYLDGSMSSSERKKLVEEFENGETPLFLISLKAGGTGLNLTAADYVIHMDPWWNPAIEDQASDRAYRIGQERPVTIYRIIAEGTVEEKILKLHSSKKSLADALLEGTEMSSRLGREEIMELLQLAGD